MEIRDLRYFCLTAELEHVTNAAEKLGVAQPFLTKIITQLENEVGLPLFDNVKRKIKLNSNGQVFYSHAKKILLEMDNLRDAMERLGEQASHTIRVWSNLEVQYPELVIEYQRLYPDYVLSLTFGSREEILAALKTGEADFAVCSPPLLGYEDAGITGFLLFREYACALLPPGHPMLKKENLRFSDMADEHLIATTKSSALRSNFDPIMEKYGYKPNIICETNDMNLLINAVMNGMGFAVIPRSLMLSRPELKEYCVSSAHYDTVGEIYLHYPTAQSRTVEECGFIQFMQDFMYDYRDKYFSGYNAPSEES